MTDPLVSIVTPSYNSGRYIQDAILTIKHQTYSHIEHIIVDGGSTDETLEVIRRHEGTYNMRWLSEPDEGMYHALNKGFQMAQGDILADLDCDDLYLSWSVETAVQALREHSLIFGDLLRVDYSKRTVNLEVGVPFLSSYYRAAGIIVQPTAFWRREVIEKIGGFDQRLKTVGDVEYWLRADSAGFRPHKIPEVLAIERRCSTSRSAQNKELLRGELEGIRQEYSRPLLRSLWRLVPVVPMVRRVQWIRYGAGSPSVWPALRASQALPMGWRELVNALWLRSRRSSLTIDWGRVLPPGVTLLSGGG